MTPRDSADEPTPATAMASTDDLVDTIEGISLTPEEHERVKDVVNGERLERIHGHERRYLVAGAGGESRAARRRRTVYDRLDARTDPSAIAMRLEDFGLAPDDLKLWCRSFDILCGRATHIVAVIEDFDGGYVWELGLIFAPSYREKAWILKRRYGDAQVERARYENAMAISHVELLLTGPRAYEWGDPIELRDVVDEIP